jgi:2-oxoglutarate dehydrogenase E2 component (dihydrolipoamide succinyltransferase)
MTKKAKILLPPLGEGIIEATLMQWLKKTGEKIHVDEPIAEIATDKVDTEVLSPLEGTLDRTFFKEGDIPKVGDLIAVLDVADGVQIPPHLLLNEENQSPAVEATKTENKTREQETKMREIITASETTEKQMEIWLSPLVKSIAKEEGISDKELGLIKGTGLSGRITRDDILYFLKNRAQNVTETSVVVEKKPETVSPNTILAEIIPMSRLRTIIAERMVQSVMTSPHVTSFVEADVTNLVQWREKNKAAFEMKYGEKLTFTPLFVEAMVAALKQFPMINVSVGKNEILVHKQMNIGMATALPSGDLIVPVIKNADEKNLLGLTRAVNDMANRARTNQLKPDEIKGGTFTFTNVGTFNNIAGTPIINQPEVAILALGAIKKRPAVIETPQGDTIGIRHQIILSLSYDHRVVDGALGGMFLAKVGEFLEKFDSGRSI